MEIKFTDINEQSRTYVFAQGEYTIDKPLRIHVRPSGTHRVEDAQGVKHIVPTGWLGIRFTAANWSL